MRAARRTCQFHGLDCERGRTLLSTATMKYLMPTLLGKHNIIGIGGTDYRVHIGDA